MLHIHHIYLICTAILQYETAYLLCNPVGHFWPYSAGQPHMNGTLASKLGVHIEIGFIIVAIYFSEYTGVGMGQWPGEWPGPVTGQVLYTQIGKVQVS